MKKTITLLFSLCCLLATAQNYEIDVFNGQTINACSGTFYDSGGQFGNYNPGEVYSVTICPNGANQSTVVNFNTFNLGVGDLLCVYNSNNTSTNLVGCYNGVSPGTVVASNPSGCLSFAFESDGFAQGFGWVAAISCQTACQTIIADVVSTVPDTTLDGKIDICAGTTVTFNGQGLFPQNNNSYTQSNALCTFEWLIEGQTFIGQNITHTFHNPGGFNVELVVTDQNGCKSNNFINLPVRVSASPYFDGTGPENSVGCIGDTMMLVGNIIPVLGDFASTFERGDSIFLPDGNGVCYTTTLNYTDFAPGQQLTNINQLKNICMNMEHSFMSDLIVSISCPNGTKVVMSNQGGGGTNLGLPSFTPLVAGVGYDYCFSPTSTNPIWQIAGGFGSGFVTGGSLNAGTYSSQNSLTSLVGCPLNGIWELEICDQIGLDDGYIFSWYVEFDQSVYPALDSFAPGIDSIVWSNNGQVVGTSDTIYVPLNSSGNQTFNYEIIDSFGCSYDTSFTFNVVGPPAQPNINCGNTNASQITVNWSPIVGATGYELNIDSAGWFTVNSTSYTLSGLPEDTPYFFQLRAKGNINCDLRSEIDTITCSTRPCLLNSSLDSLTMVTCFGANDGIAHFTSTTDINPIRYSLDGGTFSTVSTISNLTPTNHTVIVLDGNTCRDTFNFNITEPDGLVLVATSTDVLCNGDSIGTAMVQASSAIPPYSYDWSNDSTTTNISQLIAGNYTITVTDANGCQKDTTVTVNEPAALTLNLSKTDVKCFQESTGTAIATPGGGVGNFTYLWNTTPPQITDTAVGLPIGTYTVIVTDGNGCTITDSITLTEPNLLDVTIADTTQVSCSGAMDGEAFSNITGGTGPYTYLWSNNLTTPNVNNLNGGFHNLTITDANLCTDSVTFGIFEATQISLAITATDITCFGEDDGTAKVIPNGGVGNYTYLWNNTSTTDSISDLTQGNYSVTVTDGDNCSISSTVVTVTEPPVLTLSLAKTDVLCYNESNGTATATAGGGVGVLTYLWNTTPPQTTNIATNLPLGMYTVTVTDTNGCFITDSIMVNQPDTLIATITDTTRVSCFGAMDGEAFSNITGGIGPYTYAWSNGETTPNANMFDGGFHNVTITDANLCIDTAAFGIFEPTQITMSFTNTQVTCFGLIDGTATVFPTGGAGNYTYQWNTSDSTAFIDSLAGGFYRVTVTDSESCSEWDTVFVYAPVKVTIDSMSSTPTLCFGSNEGTASSSGFGGSGQLNYVWNTGQTDSTITNLFAGWYTITVSDLFGCIAIDSTEVLQPDSIELTYNVTQLLCNGDGTGAVNINTVVGGTMPYTYNWDISPSNTTTAISNLQSDTYTISVTDAQNCLQIDSVFVPEPAPLTSGTTFVEPLCFGDSNGTATILPNGGNNNYTFSWATIPIQTDTTAINLAAGTYQYTVTDLNNCSYSDSVIVTEPPLLTSIMDKVNVACRDSANGIAIATPIGGSAPYSYSWTTSSLTDSIVFPLDTGWHYVQITDTFGCMRTDSIWLTQPNYITATLTAVDLSCYESGDGQATITSNGGVGNYTYLWSKNAQTDSTATGLDAGWNYVTITDGNNCPAYDSVLVNQPPEILTTESSTLTLCYGDATGTATINPTGGIGAFTYAWNTTPIQTTQTAINLSAGDYIVTVTDATNCSKIDTVTVGQPTELVLAMSSTNMSCFGLNDGTATVVASGGTPGSGYIYAWETTGNTPTITSLFDGVYTVSVTDANGCTTIDSIGLTEPPLLVSTISELPSSCYNGNDGTAIVVPSGGTPTPSGTYNYVWSTQFPQVQDTAIFLSGGVTYTVTVTDMNNCLHTNSITITQPTPLAVSATTTPTNCSYSADGTGTVIPSGGTAPYFYNWDTSANNQTNATAIALPKGTYKVIVIDNNGCEKDTTVLIEAPSEIEITATAEDVLCKGDATGILNAEAGGGTPFYNFQWDANANNQTGVQATQLLAGNYLVTVTDNNGCIGVDTFTVIEPTDDLSATFDLTDVSCYQGLDGRIIMNGTGGTFPYQYKIDDETFSNGNNFAALPIGEYLLTIKDSHGCEFEDTVNITEPMPFWVDLGTDTTIRSDKTLTITPMITNGIPPFTYQWLPADSTLSCTDCLEPTVQDLQFEQRYELVVTDANGCQTIDDKIIRIVQIRTAYVATGMSPNNDGINDVLFVQGGYGVAKVRSLEVYDRWGEQVFEAKDTPMNDPKYGWDGTFRGQPANTGTYVWRAVVEFTDGEVLEFKGGVMLVR